MKKRINIQLMAIATVAIFATMLLISYVFYGLYKGQITDDLRIYSELLIEAELLEKVENREYQFSKEYIRITIVDTDGTVCYDNVADICELDNHLDRPEVTEALNKGEGDVVRRSQTMEKSTFYYARLLEDGRVLRLAREADSIWSLYYNALPFMGGMVLLLLAIYAVVSHYLTKSLVKPIEQLAENLDNTSEIASYEELQPFISMIKTQHDNILKSAMIRQEFTANVSHELKTPLTSISGYAELIENGMASDEDVIHFAKGIHKNSNRLLTLINDIIRLSELDGTEKEVEFEKVNLHLIAQTSLDMLQFMAQKHNVSLELRGEECFVWGNRQMLEELVYNLCDNAIRYNNDGGSVTVHLKDVDETIVMTISDTGIGIPKEAQERVFERFYRVDKSRSKSTGGTGLGLAIVKHIIVKLQAEITVESEVGKGTQISVTFHKNIAQ